MKTSYNAVIDKLNKIDELQIKLAIPDTGTLQAHLPGYVTRIKEQSSEMDAIAKKITANKDEGRMIKKNIESDILDIKGGISGVDDLISRMGNDYPEAMKVVQSQKNDYETLLKDYNIQLKNITDFLSSYAF